MAEWRIMRPADLPAVMAIAQTVHPGLPERLEVFAERLLLFPRGCLVLPGEDGLIGYVVSHPWYALSIPPLDTLLSRLPDPEETRYLHDLALLPAARGTGAGRSVVSRILREAEEDGAASISLVSVYESAPFWRRFGFSEVVTPDLADALGSYGPGARFMLCPLGLAAEDVPQGRDMERSD